MKIIIIGIGKVGDALAQSLSAEGHDITMVDQNEEVLQKCEDTLDVMCIRGNGANAKTLMDAGVDCLFLDVRESNAPARALYAACGFRESGRRSAYYRAPREDAILMERKKDEHHAVSGL